VRPGFTGDIALQTDMAQIEKRLVLLNKLCGGRYASVVHLVVTRFAYLTIQYQGFNFFLKVGQSDWDFLLVFWDAVQGRETESA